LTLLSSSVRTSPSGDDKKALRTSIGAIQSIVTSTGQNDTCLFEPNPHDERLLWFQGTGLVKSNWRIELPLKTNTFRRETLTDFVFHLRYTARDGGAQFAEDRRSNLKLPQKGRLFSAAHDFADAWYAFLHQGPDASPQTLKLNLTPDQF